MALTPGFDYLLLLLIFKTLRVRAKINFHFQVLRRLPGKAPKRRNIEIFLRLGNTARHKCIGA
jgi:hypothetical protein